MTIPQLYHNFKQMPPPDELTKKIIISDGAKITELVKTQMMHGKRGDVRKDVAKLGFYKPKNATKKREKGGTKGSSEHSVYAEMKHEMNPLPGIGIVDLKLTGAFHDAFYFDKEKLEVYSADSKTDDLMKRYGRYIFKLTPDSIKEYGQDFYGKFFQIVWQHLYSITNKRIKFFHLCIGKILTVKIFNIISNIRSDKLG